MYAKSINVILHDAHNPNKTPLKMNISSLSVDDLIKIASKHFKLIDIDILIKKLYNQCGEEITDLNSYHLSNDEHLYISSGKFLRDPNSIFHLSVIGMNGSGKSAFTIRFILDQFESDYPSDIEDAFRKIVHLDGNKILLDVLDTVEFVEHLMYLSSYSPRKDGIIFMFDICNKKSFEELDSYYAKLMEHYDNNMPPLILVGNKMDIALDTNIRNVEHIYFIVSNWYRNEIYNDIPEDVINLIVMFTEITKREISFEEGMMKVNEWSDKSQRLIKYIETSAKTGYNVHNVFGILNREIVNERIRTGYTAERPRKIVGCLLL